MSKILQLIRWKNLIIVFIAQWIIWYLINYSYIMHPQLDALYMLGLSISTILITASGYIINDYFDIKIDAINRPETLIVSNIIPKNTAIKLFNIFNIIGIFIAGVVAYHIGNLYLVIIQIITSILLWFYSTHFKKMSVIGNVIVSFLTAFSILLVLIFEPQLYQYLYKSLIIDHKVNPSILIIGISIFAFLLNWMREIVKDMEDYKGDAEYGCRTFPIVHGLKKSNQFVIALGIITLLSLVYCIIQFTILKTYDLALLIFFLPFIGLIYTLYRLPKMYDSQHYATISKLLKFIQLFGIGIILFI